jgi:hypothetical protein
MTGMRITMVGGDSAHRRAVTGLQSRLISFPDGFTRHITLTNWEWDVFDRVPHRDYLAGGAYFDAQRAWLEDTFNDAAAPPSPCTDRLRLLRETADEMTQQNPLSRSRARFEARLRYSLWGLISVNMPRVAGIDNPVNDELPQ